MLTEKHRLRVFENRVLRRIFGPKRDKVTGGWRRLDAEEFPKLCPLPSITRIIKPRSYEMDRACGMCGEKWNAHRVLAGKPDGMWPLERPTHR
jgi:hypothetical protein